MIMLSHIVSLSHNGILLTSTLLAIRACDLDHQNVALNRRQKRKKEKANMHKKANSLCTTFSTWMYTVGKRFSVKNGQNLVRNKQAGVIEVTVLLSVRAESSSYEYSPLCVSSHLMSLCSVLLGLTDTPVFHLQFILLNQLQL